MEFADVFHFSHYHEQIPVRSSSEKFWSAQRLFFITKCFKTFTDFPSAYSKYRVHVCEDRGRRGRMEAGLLSQIGAKLRKYETDHVLKQNYFQTRELYY